jgi:hypothetical protein
MRSRLTSRLVCLSITSVGCGGGGNTHCGPGDAPADGITATDGSAMLTYGGFTFGANNDCTPVGSAITSLSLFSTQTGVSGTFHFDLCIERPDQLATPQALGPDVENAAVPVHVVDFGGSANNCEYDLDHSARPSGTAQAIGACANGTDPSGFAFEVSGAIPATRTCGTAIDQVTLTVAGRAAVLPM